MKMAMVKFDHMTLPVRNIRKSRDWYVKTLGFKVEFENPKTATIAIQDSAGFTIFLQKSREPLAGRKAGLTLQVQSVDRTHKTLARKGVRFVKSPQHLFWGYGAELRDPDGYMLSLWDRVSMRRASRASAA